MEIPEWLAAELLPNQYTVRSYHGRDGVQPERSLYVVASVVGSEFERHVTRPGSGYTQCAKQVDSEYPTATLWVVDCDHCMTVAEAELRKAG